MYNEIIKSDFFVTKESDLLGNIKNKPIGSNNFIADGTRQMSAIEITPDILNDFARTLKAIVKQEMLNEMMRRIENLDTFYR